MFERALRQALEGYAAGDYALSRLQLRDLIDMYPDRLLDDVLYYASESSYGMNYFDEALDGYHRLVRTYPASEFQSKALVKLIYIYYIYNEFNKLSEAYDQLLQRRNDLQPETLGTISYLVGYAHFKSGSFNQALRYLRDVAPESPYFYPALYLSGACFSNLGKDDLALSIYTRLLKEEGENDENPILSQIKDNILLKLGMIYYEQGDNERAVAFFNQVSQNFQQYDLSLIGKAWSAYRAGKPGEALRSVEWVLQNSMISNYVYEARVLAANSKALLGQGDEAIRDLKSVYQTGIRVEELNTSPAENQQLVASMQDIESIQNQYLDEKDRDLMGGIGSIRRFLGSSPLKTANLSETSNQPDAVLVQRAESLSQTISDLDWLEDVSQAIGTRPYLDEIRRLRRDFIQLLDDHTLRFTMLVSDPGDDPLVRRLGMEEYIKYLFSSSLVQILREKQQVNLEIQQIVSSLNEIDWDTQFDSAIQMEIRKEELEDYYGRLNQYEVWLRENFPKEFRVELDRWTTFSGYGISNINFSRIQDLDERISQISQTIDAIENVFSAKRKGLERRIQGLLSDVETIEEQMRLEAEKKELEEKDRFFRSQYFDKQRGEATAGKLREDPTRKEGKK